MEPQKDKTPNFCEEIVIKTCRGLIVEDRDYFLLFGLLHHYRFILFAPIDDDGYTTSDFDGFSWRGCSDFLTRMWVANHPGTELSRIGKRGQPETEYMYWYNKWMEWGNYEAWERLSSRDHAKLHKVLTAIRSSPMVKSVELARQ